MAIKTDKTQVEVDKEMSFVTESMTLARVLQFADEIGIPTDSETLGFTISTNVATFSWSEVVEID